RAPLPRHLSSVHASVSVPPRVARARFRLVSDVLSPDELDPGDSAGPPPPARGPPLREREGAPRGAGPAARAGGLPARRGPSGASLLAGSRPCPDLLGPPPAPA